MTTATQAETVFAGEQTFPEISHADRSDAHASGAVQALVRVVKDGRDLLLDGHAFVQHEPALIASGWSVQEDARERFLNPPKTSFDTNAN